jgi:hypothetical protein
MKTDKEEFLRTTVVEWDKEAKERQGFLFEYKERK